MANPVVLIIAEETDMTKKLRRTTRASNVEVNPRILGSPSTDKSCFKV